MSARHDVAARLAVLRVLLAELTTARKAMECELSDLWHPGDRNTASLPDGTAIAAVSLTKGRAEARITDEAAYRAWVEKTHPEEIETITRINPEFTDRLKAAARKLGTPVDAATGEIVPGLSVGQGDPYPSVRLADDAAALVTAAWQKGQLTELLGGLLAIEGPES